MNRCINFGEFMRYLVDDEKLVAHGSKIIHALLKAQSPRLTNITEKMTGKGESCYKGIQRFLNKVFEIDVTRFLPGRR